MYEWTVLSNLFRATEMAKASFIEGWKQKLVYDGDVVLAAGSSFCVRVIFFTFNFKLLYGLHF